MQQAQERRRAPRAKFSGAVIVNTPGSEITCVGGDLSESGMLVFPPKEQQPAPGDPIQLRFTLPRLYRWLSCEGEVVRQASVNHRTGWGVRFAQVTAEVRRVIRTFVAAGHGQVIEYEPLDPAESQQN